MRSERLLATTALALLGVLLATPIGAHANLVASSPGTGARVGGVVDGIEMIFDEPITELAVTVEGPDGIVVDAQIDARGPQHYDAGFEPLRTDGLYIVRYDFVSLDTDWVELSYVFQFLEGEPAPLPLTIAVPDPPGPAWQQPWALALLAVLGAVVTWQAVRLVRGQRALARSG